MVNLQQPFGDILELFRQERQLKQAMELFPVFLNNLIELIKVSNF